MEQRVVRETVLPAPRRKVWAALTEPEHLAHWLGGDVQIDPRPRGRVALRGTNGLDRRGRVIAVNRPYRLVIEWWEARDMSERGDVTRVEFVLEEEEAGTRLTVCEGPALLARAFTEAG